MNSRRTALVVPVIAVALVAGGSLIPKLRSGASTDLPPLTATQILTKALSNTVQAYSGHLVSTADLGLPSGFSSGSGQTSGRGFSPLSLLSGVHDFSVWSNTGAGQFRLAGGSTRQTDLVVNSSGVYRYDGSSQRVTRYLLPSTDANTRPRGGQTGPMGHLANRVAALAAATYSDISVGTPMVVAGRSAYTLQVAPSSAEINRSSTVSRLEMEVDATTGMPLEVKIFAKGQSAPAFSLGFSSLTLSPPAAGIFSTPHGLSRSVSHSLTQSMDGTWLSRLIPGPSGASRSGTPQSPWAVSAVGDTKTFSGLLSGRFGNLTNSPLVAGLIDPVNGSFGPGEAVHTSLVNLILLSDGRIAIGDVTLRALENQLIRRGS